MNLDALFAGVFRDPSMQAKFERSGYVLVDDFLTGQQIEALSSVFDLEEHGNAPIFSATPLSQNIDYRRRTHEAIVGAFAERSAALLDDFRLYAGGFTAKTPAHDESGSLSIHQDPSFTNDLEWPVVRIWVPLCDLTPENGALSIVAGTHAVNRFPRAFSGVFPYPALDHVLRELATPLYLRAGQALLAATALFHFSPPNHSATTRVAAAAVAMPAAAPLWFIHDDPAADTYAVHEVDNEFYLTHDLMKGPREGAILRCGKFCEPLDEVRLRTAVSRALEACAC